MSEENKSVELKDEELQKVAGGAYGSSGDNWTITINCFDKGPFYMRIKEDSFTLEVHPDTTVLQVKQMIYDKYNIDTQQQLLILMGKKLEEPDKLADKGVVDGSVINLGIKFHY